MISIILTLINICIVIILLLIAYKYKDTLEHPKLLIGLILLQLILIIVNVVLIVS
jgi:hypothetical protein